MKKHYTEYLSSSQERPDIQHHLFQSIETTTLRGNISWHGANLFDDELYRSRHHSEFDVVENIDNKIVESKKCVKKGY